MASVDPTSDETIWITGGTGLIGGYLVRHAPARKQPEKLAALGRSEFDLTDHPQVCARFALDQPGLVIHAAALTSSAQCEQSPAQAREINVEATRLLCELCQSTPLVFFSSDLVFDGSQGNYLETDTPNPLNVYGETKLEAETLVLSNPMHLVLRTSLNGGISRQGQRSFNEQLHHAWRNRQCPTLFLDEYRNPIPAAVTAQIVWHLVREGRTGLYHLAGAEKLSRVEIGELLAAQYPELSPRWKSTSLATYHGPPRSPDTTLNCSKLTASLPFPLPKFSEWLETHPEDIP